MAKSSERKTYHHGDLRRAVIDAAVEVIAERGVHGLNVREVARRAGVSSGAPYRHFADKEALLAAIAVEGSQLLRDMVAAESAVAPPRPLDQFRAMGIANVMFAVRHPEHFRVMTTPELDLADGDEALASEVAAHEAAMRDAIEASQRAGALYDVAPDIIALTARSLVYGLARLFVDGQLAREGIGAERAAELAIAVTDVLGHGLIPRPPSDPASQSTDCPPDGQD